MKCKILRRESVRGFYCFRKKGARNHEKWLLVMWEGVCAYSVEKQSVRLVLAFFAVLEVFASAEGFERIKKSFKHVSSKTREGGMLFIPYYAVDGSFKNNETHGCLRGKKATKRFS